MTSADQVWLTSLLGRHGQHQIVCQRFIINGWSKLSKSHLLNYWTPLISLTTYRMTVWVSNNYIVSLSSNTSRTRVRILANHAPRYRVPWCPFFSFPTPIFKNGSPKPWALSREQPWNACRFSVLVQETSGTQRSVTYGLNMRLNMFKWWKKTWKCC